MRSSGRSTRQGQGTAGCGRGQGHRWRRPARGRARQAHSLRLWALADLDVDPGRGKLLTGWFADIGLEIRFEVVDNGVASDAMYAWKGDSPAPDYDMILWFCDGYYDPGSTLQCFTTSQIGSWNEVYWSRSSRAVRAAA